jgi:hypothetical protein
MSHFSSIQTQLCDRNALIQGLQTLLAEHQIAAELEVHDQPMPMENAYARRDKRDAHIILRRSFLNTRQRQALVDVGFLQTKSGVFQAMLDAWDVNQNALGEAFQMTRSIDQWIAPTQQFLNAVQVAHDVAYVEAQYPPSLWEYDRQINEDGTVQLSLTQKVDLATVSAGSW